MGEGQQDEYEERLQEVFHSFDASGAGSLCPAELAELCQALHLDEAAPVLLHALLQNQDRLDGRVDFDQFKDALILVLSSTVEQPAQPSQDASTQPDSPELHPKFVKGSKRYGRRSTPEFIETTSDFRGMPEDGEEEEREEEHPQEGSDDGSTVPRKRERWTTEASSPEEYEAEGQLHLWNPDEPGTPRASAAPPCGQLEEQLRQACQELALPWHGQTTHAKLQALCQRLGMEISEEAFQALDREGVMNVQEFVSYVLVQNQPPTPSASTPYRQLKRHHSVQAFDETGRRIATPSTMSGTIGMRLFSSLDDGTGYTPVEYLLDAWMEEGIENSPEILKALDFSLDGKVNLSELTAALENELLITKNGLHQAALASFKVEIRHLLERVDLELREKEKIRSDLEKAERLKTQLASEVDEHHSAIERMNDINLRKQEHEHKEKLAAVRAELTREMDLIQQQANLQREEMEAEIEKIRDDENFLREHLTLTIKDNGRLEAELLDSTEKLVEAENHVDKLQRNLDNILREKFGDLDPDSAEFFLQEDRLRQLRNSYEEQCRELQDRIDELQAQLEEYHVLGRAPPTSIMPSLSDELENMSPGMESDPGLGSEEGQPFNMSLEAEMMYEQLKEQHSREVEHVQAKLETKASEYNQRLEEQRASHEKLSTQLTEQHQEEVQVLKQEVTRALEQAQSLQAQLEHVELEQQNLEQSQALQLTELQKCHEEEASHLQQELQQARSHTEELEAQLRTLDGKLEAAELSRRQEKEELDELYKKQLSQMELLHQDMLKARAAEERAKLQEEMEEMQRKLREEFERERQWLEESQKEVLRAELEGEKQKAEEKCKDLERKLEEEWEKQRAQLEEGNKMALQVLVEEELLRLVKEQEERERKHTEQWKLKQCELEDQHAAKLQSSLAEERELWKAQQEEEVRKLEEVWERAKLHTEEQHEEMLLARLEMEREKFHGDMEEQEQRFQEVMELERNKLEVSHREVVQELRTKHSEEKEKLSCTLDKLRGDIAEERRELESLFSQRLRDVEARIMCDQDAVSDRFQSAMAKLEQHHQSELQALSEQHSKDWAKWEAEMEAASEAAQEHRRLLREAMQLEKDTLTQELAKERELLELRHKEEMEALRAKNLELQNELENFISSAQTKEIELSRHLNELHNRLQQNLNTRDELLAHSEKKVEEVEQLLHQAVQDFAVERTELQDNLSDLEGQYKETLAQAEKQLEERKNLLAEREQLTGKVREFEQLLQQAAEDFENEKLELKTNLAELQEKLSESASIAKMKQREEAELLAERNRLAVKIQRIEAELIPLLGPKRNMTTIVEEDEESLQLASTKADVNSEVKLETGCCGNCPENITFVVSACEDEIIEVDHSEDFIVFAEESSVDEEASHSDEKVAGIEHAEADTDVIVVSVELHNKAVVIEDLDKINMARVEFVESSSGVAPQLAEIQNGLVVNTLEVTTCTELIDGPGGMAEVSRTETECADADYVGIKKVVEDVDADIKVNTGITHVDISGDDNSGENAKTESNSFFKSVESIDEPGINRNDKSESFYSLIPDLEYSNLETEFRNEADNSTTVMSQHGSCPKQKNRDESTSSMFTDREEVTFERGVCVRESLVLQNGLVQFQDQMCLIASLLTQYSVASGHNLVLQQKVAELQQRTDELEGPLGINKEEIDTSQQALEENCDVNALAQQVKEFEVKALELSELQIRHQECISENHRLEEKNGMLEKRLLSLEGRMHVQNICDQHGALLDEIARMRKENSKLSALVQDLERQDKMFLTLQQDAIESSKFISKAPYMDPGLQLETKMHAVSDLEDCCTEFERQNNRLRKALTDLQERSQTIHERMLAHRGEVGRLAEDNLSLRQKISELQIEDLRENHEDMLQKLENYRKEKVAAQKLAESLKRQISELHRRGQQLEDENIMLSQQNVENMASVVELSQQLGQVIQYSDRREGLRRHDNSFPDEKREMVACVSAMEAELNKTQEGKVQLEQERTHLLHQLSTLRDQLCEGVDFASAASRTQQLEEEKELLREELKRCVEKMAKLGAVEDQLTHVMHERQVAEKQNQGLRTQISKAHEKIQALDSTLQSTSVQTARFKSDLRVTQQERDNLKQEVMSLHNQLQNANDKSQVLEMALHSSGYQKQQKKLFWDEMSRLLEKEQTLLREENERLQREVKEMHADLQRTREKARQLEAAVGSLRQQKQQSQACLAKAVEQEKVALKRELDALHKELLTTRSKVCESSEALREVESLRQENEGLRSKQARLESQLIEQGGILPQSPVRLPGEWRGHHHGDEQGPDFNLQEDREIAMLKMEGRMREVELTLRNVKMLLQEKVSQLKEQLHKNSKADIMIKDLYVENAQLLKALEMTEQRQKVAEKKNYLLEEKISSLNKIVRDLGPPALTAVPYHFTRS